MLLLSQDGSYHRCQVLEAAKSHTQVKIVYLDFGDVAVLDRSDLFEISEELANVPIVCQSFQFNTRPAGPRARHYQYKYYFLRDTPLLRVLDSLIFPQIFSTRVDPFKMSHILDS